MSVELDLKPLESQTVAAVKEIFGCRLRCVLVYESAVWGKFNHEADIQIRVLAELDDWNAYYCRVKSLERSLDQQFDLLVELRYLDTAEFYRYCPYVPLYKSILTEGIVWYKSPGFQLNRQAWKALSACPPEDMAVLTPEKLIDLRNTAVRRIKEILGSSLEQIILFGSYARQDYEDYSDVDIMVLGSFSESQTQQYEQDILNLSVSLSQEYPVDVNLKINRTCDYRRQVLPLFRNIAQQGVVWYG